MLKSVLKSISKNKIPVLFIVIQISFMFFTLNQAMDSFWIIESQEEFLSEELKENKENLLRVSVFGVPSQTLSNQIVKLENYIAKINEVKYHGGIDAPFLNFDELLKNEKYKNIINETYGSEGRGAHTEASDVVLIDKGLENLLNLKVSKGRNLIDTDFNLKGDGPIPVLLGGKFKEFMKEGDILTDSLTFTEKKKFIVVGFLEENSLSINVDGQYISSIPSKLDTFIIIPSYEDMNNMSLHINSKMDSYFVIVKDKQQLNNIKKLIKLEMESIGIEGDVTTFEDEFIAFKNENRQITNTASMLIAFLLVMSLFSLISVILFSIRKRMYNIGVMITCGASMKYIKRMILLEIALISIIGFLIANIAIVIDTINYQTIFLQQPLSLQETFNFDHMFLMLIVTFIFIMIASYIPLKKLNKLSAKDLIVGKE